MQTGIVRMLNLIKLYQLIRQLLVPLFPCCQASWWGFPESLPGDWESSLFSAPCVSPECGGLSTLPNFSSSFFSFSAQAASLSSRARLSSSSRLRRALSTASETSGETNFPRGGGGAVERWGSSCSSKDSLAPLLFCSGWWKNRTGIKHINEISHKIIFSSFVVIKNSHVYYLWLRGAVSAIGFSGRQRIVLVMVCVFLTIWTHGGLAVATSLPLPPKNNNKHVHY